MVNSSHSPTAHVPITYWTDWPLQSHSFCWILFISDLLPILQYCWKTTTLETCIFRRDFPCTFLGFSASTVISGYASWILSLSVTLPLLRIPTNLTVYLNPHHLSQPLSDHLYSGKTSKTTSAQREVSPFSNCLCFPAFYPSRDICILPCITCVCVCGCVHVCVCKLPQIDCQLLGQCIFCLLCIFGIQHPNYILCWLKKDMLLAIPTAECRPVNEQLNHSD